MRTIPERVVVLVLAVALSSSAASCGGGSTSDRAGTNPDGNPTFETVTVGGEKFTSASFDGKPTVLWFWAPWCTVCRAEAPSVSDAATELKSNVDFIGVAGRGEVAEMEQFIDQTGVGNFTHVVDDDGSIWSAYGVVAQPAFAFIDADGEVSMTMGTLDHDKLIEKAHALAES